MNVLHMNLSEALAKSGVEQKKSDQLKSLQPDPNVESKDFQDFVKENNKAYEKERLQKKADDEAYFEKERKDKKKNESLSNNNPLAFPYTFPEKQKDNIKQQQEKTDQTEADVHCEASKDLDALSVKTEEESTQAEQKGKDAVESEKNAAQSEKAGFKKGEDKSILANTDVPKEILKNLAKKSPQKSSQKAHLTLGESGLDKGSSIELAKKQISGHFSKPEILKGLAIDAEKIKISEKSKLLGDKTDKNLAQNLENTLHNTGDKSIQIGDKIALKENVQKPQSLFKIIDVYNVSEKKQGNLQTLQIELHPSELGSVTAKMRISKDSLHIDLHASNEKTAQILAHDRLVLKNLLEKAGVKDDKNIFLKIIDNTSKITAEIRTNPHPFQQEKSGNEQSFSNNNGLQKQNREGQNGGDQRSFKEDVTGFTEGEASSEGGRLSKHGLFI